MRVSLALLASVLLASGASAQDGPGYKGLSASDLKKYCIFADQLFSEGAVFCSAKNYAMICGKDGNWTTASRDKLDPVFCLGNPSLTPLGAFSGEVP